MKITQDTSAILGLMEVSDKWLIYKVSGKRKEVFLVLDHEPSAKQITVLMAHAVMEGFKGIKVQKWGCFKATSLKD